MKYLGPRGYGATGILRALGLWWKSSMVKPLRKTVSFLKHETSIYYVWKEFYSWVFKRNKNVPPEELGRKVFIAA